MAVRLGVDAKNGFFWLLIGILLCASLFFGLNAEARRRTMQRFEVALNDGDRVSLASVVDGDTVVVQKQDGAAVAVRLLGIKAFDPTREKEATARFGRSAMDAIHEIMGDRLAVVELGNPPKDKYGRVLARLLVEEQPVGLSLIRRGLALVYTAFPFDQMPLYLEEQEKARANREGLWGDPALARQADLLDREWRRQAR